ncbi:acyl-CoA thioesterase [Mangrovibacillus cuniculi]|uniref:Acyl-CoA thioesterase n=1 Tax=Mangrovibacillus cuniculi TaxID=2593652 RepID=A0A7S8CBW7_9BACI|nr:acyl-CoA thioesterase [Mangrovibacillus cuniculi]QPC47155.1 acyl-CoA thioesterase [Mangrovibacillus cuniculi]
MSRISYIQDQEKWASEFRYFHPITVRFSETDMFGHLNNTVPFVYFEESRIAYLEKVGFMGDWLKSRECIPVVADLQCDFVQQVYFGEKLTIGVKANSLGRSSVDIHYWGRKEDGSTAFTGRGTMVQVHAKTGKSVEWDEKSKEVWALSSC